MDRLAPPAQQHGVAGAKAQGRRIDRDVRAAFVDDPDQADRHPDAGQAQAVGTLVLTDDGTHRIGKAGNRANGLHDSIEPRRIEPQPVDHRTR